MAKRNYEDIKKYIEGPEGNGCKLITSKRDYADTHTNMLIMCKCGNKFETSFHCFSREKTPQKQCKKCGVENRINKRTTPKEVFVKKMVERFKNDFTVCDYKNMREHAQFTHKCGYTWSTSPQNFLRDGGCPKCNKRRADIDTNSFKQTLYELVGNEYTLKSEYTTAINKITLTHNKCKRDFETTPHQFLRGSRCPMCLAESRKGKLHKDTKTFKNELIHLKGRKDNGIFKKELSGAYDNEYELIGEYKGARIKTLIKHNKCGNVYEVTPDNILRGKKCPYCAKHTPINDLSFRELIEKLYPGEYTIIGKYKNMHTKINVKHNKCGNILNVEPNELIRENCCSYCRSSKGEKRIEKFLKSNGINFKMQYIFKDCKITTMPLRFDFAVFSKRDKLKCCIEYDGVQHYKDIDAFGGKDGFIKTLYRDTVKDHYCKDHKIKLIRIPYWDYENIEKILGNLFI